MLHNLMNIFARLPHIGSSRMGFAHLCPCPLSAEQADFICQGTQAKDLVASSLTDCIDPQTPKSHHVHFAKRRDKRGQCRQVA